MVGRDDEGGGGEMPDFIHRIRHALRRAFRRFETQRSNEPPFVASWDLTFQIVVDYDELDSVYVAECLDLPGCLSQGDTPEEALHNLDEAIKGVMLAIVEERMAAELEAVEGRRRAATPEPRKVQESTVAMKIALDA